MIWQVNDCFCYKDWTYNWWYTAKRIKDLLSFGGTKPISSKIVSTPTTYIQHNNLPTSIYKWICYILQFGPVSESTCVGISASRKFNNNKKGLHASPTHYNPSRHSGLLLMRLKSTWKEQDMDRLILAKIADIRLAWIISQNTIAQYLGSKQVPNVVNSI